VVVIQDSARAVSLSRTSWSAAKGGATVTTTVSAYNQETWTAESDSPWILVGPLTSPGQSSLVIAARPNASGATRTGSVTVTSSGGATVTLPVSQAG
jgi:hypothetical protein